MRRRLYGFFSLLRRAHCGRLDTELVRLGLVIIVVHCLTASPPQVWAERSVKTGVKAGQREVPDEYCCPIMCELMKEPVLCMEDGQTYERCAIEQWFSRPGAKTSPSTGATLASTTLAPNYALKSLIAGWKAQRSRARD